MMRALSRVLSISILFLGIAATASAQSISNITPAYGGAGPNSPSSFTITGTGFTNPYMQKTVRFVDVNGGDVFGGVDCTAGGGTTCTASNVKPYRLGAGVVTTIQVYAMVNGVKSVSSFPFMYYGAPIVSSVLPSEGPYNSNTPYLINGGPFTTGGSFPGTTSVYLYSSIFDGTCGATTQCSRTATAVTTDCCVGMGAYNIDIRTPGGFTNAYFKYGPGAQTPATPTITSVSPAFGVEGNVVTITGTNFISGSTRTQFTFFTKGGFGTSNLATGVSCNPTSCTMTVPNGGSGGLTDIQVVTSCAANTSPCSGNARVSSSIPFTKTNAFVYAGIKVTTDNNTYNLYTNENGTTAQYRVSLYSQPTASVTVAVSLSGGGAGVLLSPSMLTFTPQNWAAPQTVTVTGGINSGGGNFGFTIRNVASSSDPNYNGIERDTAITNQDNAAKNYTVTPTSGLVTTRAGGTATFKAVLSAAPTATVTMKFTSSDPVAGTVSPTSVIFDTTSGLGNSWNTPRTITVTGQNDGTPGKNRDYSILITTASGDATYGNMNTLYPPDVFVNNIDAATPPAGFAVVRTSPTSAMSTWNTVGSADYYNVKFSTTPGGAKTTLASGGAPVAALSGLTPGQPYYFVVSSVNAGGESVNSAEVPFIILPPAPFGTFGSGDGKSEMTYYKATGEWKILNSAGGFTSSSTVALGGIGHTPVPGDYDGDGRQDVAVYNDTTGLWSVLKSGGGSLTISWGGSLYRPVPGDYDGDGKTDLGVYRVSSGTWTALLSSTNYSTTIAVPWGGAGYVPVPGQDFDGDLKSDVTVYNQSTGTWYVLKSSTNYTTTITKPWGGVGYTLVPGDYDGDGKADLGLYKRSTGTWTVLLSGANFTTSLIKDWGGVGYFPVAADFDGDGKADLGVFQEGTGNWYVLLSSANFTTSVSATAWGTTGDRIISTTIVPPANDVSRASDFDNDSKADITVYNPTSGGWSTLLSASNFVTTTSGSWGGGGTYTAVPGDYDGDGRTDRGVYQASTGNWTILLSSDNFTTVLNKSVGGSTWIPVPGDYDGDGKTDFVVYKASTGQWYGLKSSTNYTTTVNVFYGGAGYTPVTGDFDGDGKTDLGVYQASSGNWSILLAVANYTTGLTSLVGGSAYVPVQADYDGDSKTDFVVYNPTTGLWYGLLSSTNYTTTVNVTWGGAIYTPVRGDYDGDGRADLAAYVQSTGNIYILLSSTTYSTTIVKPFGGPSYLALPKYP